MSSSVFLPLVQTSGGANPKPEFCGMNSLAATLFNLIHHDLQQEREELKCDARLVAAAQWKAEDLAAHDLWGHIASTGEYPNGMVRRFGYRLPDSYADGANYCESIFAGSVDPVYVLSELLKSDTHRNHVLGEDSFFREQECAGVGYVESSIGFGHYWVILIAHCES